MNKIQAALLGLLAVSISGCAAVIKARCMERTLCVSCYQNTRFISRFISYIDFTDNERSP